MDMLPEKIFEILLEIKDRTSRVEQKLDDHCEAEQQTHEVAIKAINIANKTKTQIEFAVKILLFMSALSGTLIACYKIFI